MFLYGMFFTMFLYLLDTPSKAGTPSGDKSQQFTSTGVTREQLHMLKETVPKALNEPLLQKLADIEQVSVVDRRQLTMK